MHAHILHHINTQKIYHNHPLCEVYHLNCELHEIRDLRCNLCRLLPHDTRHIRLDSGERLQPQHCNNSWWHVHNTGMVHIVLHQMEYQHAMEADCTVDNSGRSWGHKYYAGIHTVPSAIHKHRSDIEGRWSYSSTSQHQMKESSQLHVLTALSMERSTVIQLTDCSHSILYQLMLSNASNWPRI